MQIAYYDVQDQFSCMTSVNYKHQNPLRFSLPAMLIWRGVTLDKSVVFRISSMWATLVLKIVQHVSQLFWRYLWLKAAFPLTARNVHLDTISCKNAKHC